MKKIKYHIEIRPVIYREIEARDWQEAKEILKAEFDEHPWTYDDPTFKEMFDVTPPNKKAQSLLDKLKAIIEERERAYSPDSMDVDNIHFGDDDLRYEETEIAGEDVPRYVYADIITYDGGGGQTIEKNVEYDVQILLEKE